MNAIHASNHLLQNGLAKDPEDRPLLPDFIKALHDLLAVPLLKLWLELFSDEKVENFISTYLNQYTDDQLTRLVLSLLQSQNPRAEFFIDCLQRHQPDYCKDGLFDLFKVIAEFNSNVKKMHTDIFS